MGFVAAGDIPEIRTARTFATKAEPRPKPGNGSPTICLHGLLTETFSIPLHSPLRRPLDWQTIHPFKDAW